MIKSSDKKKSPNITGLITDATDVFMCINEVINHTIYKINHSMTSSVQQVSDFPLLS